MRIFGIVAEYNPFHNGHLYQIQETRRKGASHIIAVMSGNYVQRGDVAIIDKFKRAELAVKCGVDMVIELPTPYALSSAEFFANGAISILSSLGCVDGISFGSECGDINALKDTAIAVNSLTNSNELKLLLKDGNSYPSAIQMLTKNKYGENISGILSHPNNLLGIEYLKAIRNLNSDFDVVTIKRKSVHHDSNIPSEKMASASFIRNTVLNNNFDENFVPREVNEAIKIYQNKGNISDINNFNQIMLYKLRTMSIENISKIPDVSQGLENRIFSCIKSANSIEELMFLIKTKRYPMAKIRRILLLALLDIDNSYMKIRPPYARILAVNSKGCEILRIAKDSSEIPVSTSLLKLSKFSDETRKFCECEAKATDIYALSSKTTKTCGLDYTAKIQKII